MINNLLAIKEEEKIKARKKHIMSRWFYVSSDVNQTFKGGSL